MKRSVLVNNAEKRKRDILDYIIRAERNGIVPSVREICEGTGIPSASTVHTYLKKLEEEGRVFPLPDGKRTVRLLAESPKYGVFPLLTGTALNGDFFHPSKIIATLTSDGGNGEGLFGLLQEDNCLAEKGILNGDMLICRRASSVKEGDIAVYEKEGRLTVALFSTVGGNFLLSTDKSGETLSEIKIYGKVIGLRRSIEKAEKD